MQVRPGTPGEPFPHYILHRERAGGNGKGRACLCLDHNAILERPGLLDLESWILTRCVCLYPNLTPNTSGARPYPKGPPALRPHKVRRNYWNRDRFMARNFRCRRVGMRYGATALVLACVVAIVSSASAADRPAVQQLREETWALMTPLPMLAYVVRPVVGGPYPLLIMNHGISGGESYANPISDRRHR